MTDSLDALGALGTPETVPPVLVMGVGNPLMRDEGVGPKVLDFLLDGFVFPESVELIDAGTMGYMIIDLLRHRERLLVIDAIKDTGLDPGTIVLLSPEDIAPNTVLHSMHDLRVIDVLNAAHLMDVDPETMCVGVQIEAIEEWVLELSDPVERAVPAAAGIALSVLAEWGVHAEPREGSDAADRVELAMRLYAPSSDSHAGTRGPATPGESSDSPGSS